MTPCDECAIRLFNDKQHNIKGVGNAMYGNMLILSNVDNYKLPDDNLEFSKQVEIVKNCISEIGRDITENVYITPLIKCSEIRCTADETVIKNCIKILASEFKQYQPIRIMITGLAVSRFLGIDSITEYINKCIISSNGRMYFVNYSPLIKYKDVDKFEIFKQHLINWYCSCRN